MSMNALPKTLIEAVKFFQSPDNCREYLVARRWPNGVSCPECGSKSVYFDSSRDGWECKTRHPNRKFTLKTGTIFEDSPLGLDKWLLTVWMIANCKNGVSSWEIHRAIGVTQKTAWFMLHRIRLAMQDQSSGGGKLGGDVELDETYIGGKARNMLKSKVKRIGLDKRENSMAGKVAVMGLLERHANGGSKIRLEVVEGRKRRQLTPSRSTLRRARRSTRTRIRPTACCRTTTAFTRSSTTRRSTWTGRFIRTVARTSGAC
jgi:transposase-like protein